MARVPCKHLLLVAFFLLFFIATTARARNMPVAKENQKVIQDDRVVTGTETEDHVRVDELVAMDYSPATRKPPIHN
ncbi:root meristem growth factor 9, GOLVEN 2, CLE-like 9 [Hibiscus trionum]|uniref:Root meristem growth factor 9, GOLVEN 2, CLE-like 9 n=1 Tax=Hibiscus trionum TaxID=183268 RepID=A0A9W7H1B8_HIBTR|nr:root meristem growth factor 9, GOLVEN 2, CLE-like 9 [Hibiscus trionum]